MSFPVEKSVDLSFLGPNWNGASVVFSGLSFRETSEFSNLNIDPNNPSAEDNVKSFKMVSDLLTKKFVNGKAWDGSMLVDLKKDDITDLPIEAVNKCIEAVTGSVNPNS